MNYILPLMVFSTLIFACKTSDNTKTSMNTAKLTGTVTKLDRMAIPPNAELYFTLEDVSIADAPSVKIAEKTMPTAGKQLPIAFELAYDAGKIQPGRRYNLRVLLNVDGKTMYRSTQANPVINNGPTEGIELMLDRQ